MSDAAGNAATQHTSPVFAVDTTGTTSDAASADWGSVLNSTEDNSDGTVSVTTSGAEDGQTVTVGLNGQSYTGTVASGSASITIATSGLQALTDGTSYPLSVDVSDAAGNAATQHTSTVFAVDNSATTVVAVSVDWGSGLRANEDTME